MAVATVLFDFGGTLAHPRHDPFDDWLAFAEREGVSVDRAALEQAHAEATEKFTPVMYDHLGRMREFWIAFDADILGRLGVPDPQDRIATAIHRGFRDETGYEVYPETWDVLRALRARGLALGVVSNATEELVDHMEAIGLARHFDAITFSQEARAEKPAPKIFELALRRARCRPEDAMHVGDRYEMDVVGARGVGIAPVLVDRDGRHADADCPRIEDLRGMLDLIG